MTVDVTPAPQPEPDPQQTPRRRLFDALRPRATRAQLLVALLCALLGFGIAVQARQTRASGLDSLRTSDLVGLLGNVTERATRLDAENRDLEATRAQLVGGSDSARAALQAAAQREQVLGVLAGTLPAHGPGIRLVVSDPGRKVNAAQLVDTLQELRDAGAEAIQLDDVRIVASTSFVDTPDGITIDGTLVKPPHVWLAIGDPPTLAAALDIPGGVLAVLRQKGATGTVTQQASVQVSSLHVLSTPQYARPSTEPTP